MGLVTEHLNGGIVTARDATELRPGELQRGDECVYRLHDSAIYGRPGRTAYNSGSTIQDSTGATCAVKGLGYLGFSGVRTAELFALGGDDNGHGTLWNSDFSSIAGGATWTRVTGPGQVTDAVINNSTTVTSASGGFANMVQGARIMGTGIPNDSYVITVTSANTIVISNATTGGLQTVTATFDMGIAASPNDTGSEVMDIVQWGQLYYAAGFGPLQRVFYKKRSIPGTALSPLFISRSAGLDPVIVAPTVTAVTGTWPSALGNGFYWFVVTEVYNPEQDDEVEGTYTARDVNDKKLGPVVGHITDYTTQTIQITFPAPVNTGSRGRVATHWAVYMSPKQDDSTTVPSLATFRRVAVTYISNTTLTLTDTSTATNPNQSKYSSAVAAAAGRNQFTNPSRLSGAPDNLMATSSDSQAAMNKLQTFGFSTGAPYATGTVTGIQVFVTGGRGNSITLPMSAFNVYLTTTGGKSSGPVAGSFVQEYETKTLGGQFDTWGVAWVPSDFADGTFEVLIECRKLGFNQNLNIDAVRVVVFYSGGTINLNGKPFRVVTYRDRIGFTIDEPANLPPPLSNTVETFQGSIVSNDLSDPAGVRWSLPGAPEAWPSPYRLDFMQDAVTCIEKLNQILVVGLRASLHRVNYLPSETDTDFREGPSHEPISPDHGIVGPLAAVKFTRPGGGTYLAYVSYNAVHMTDGVSSTFLSRDIRITDYIAPAYIQNCIFKNYSKEQWLVLFYTPIGGTRNTKALIFTYDQTKEDGTLRAIGPITVSARSATEATLNGTSLLLTGHQFGGKVWVEDQGSDLTGYTTDGSTQVTAAPSIITRRFYPAGVDRNARTEKQYVQHDAAGSTTTLTNVVMTAGSTTITRAAGFAGVTKGMRVVSTNIPGDTVVTAVAGTSATISSAAFETTTASVSFDTGTISLTIRAQSIGAAIAEVATTYSSMVTGGLLSTALDAHAQAFDLMIEKVRMPDDTLTDLNVAMRLHHFTYQIADAGVEQSRAGAL